MMRAPHQHARRRGYYFGIVLLGALACTSALGQQKEPTPEKAQADTAQQEKAYALLGSLADQLGTLQSTENRARLASNLAASFWTHDEKRARTLMVSVESDIRTGLQNADSDDREDMQTRMVFLQLRVDTVERIAKYDSELALAFFRATEVTSDKRRDPGIVSQERALEMRLAAQVSGENPEVALKLARQSLARGFSYELINLLPRLNKKHKEQAQLLYKEIVAKLREEKVSRETLYFAISLVRGFRPPQADALTYRDLIRALITAALENGCGEKMSDDDERGGFCGSLGWLVPEMERIDPARAARLKQWAPEEESDWSMPYSEMESLGEDGTVDDILALTSKYPQFADQIQWRAIQKAVESADLTRARKLATDYSGPAEIRQQMLTEVENREKIVARNEAMQKDIDRALTTIPNMAARLEFLFEAANRVGANDRKASLKLLNQAAAMVDTMKPGPEQSGAQAGLAIMYCMENSSRGLDLMESLMPKLNELVSAAVKLDGYETYNVREGEWNMSGAGKVGNLLSVLAQNAGYFAWCDFDRAVSITGQFERPEIRMMAQLKLAQSILAGRPKRGPVTIPNQNRSNYYYGTIEFR